MHTLRARLLLLVLLTVTPALGLNLYTGAAQRRLVAERVETHALHLARLVSASQARLVEGARQLLVTLSHLPEVRDRKGDECNTLLADLVAQYPLYLNLGVIALDGQVICSGVPLPGPTNLADRTYFQRALQTRDFAIGDYQIGRITGKPSVNFGYPVLSESGQVQAVVFAAMDLEWFNQLPLEVQLPPGASLTVLDGNGLILARYPDPEQWIGKSVPEAPLVQAILQQREGVTRVNGLDGIRRLYAFTPLSEAPQSGSAFVSLGIPADGAYADVDLLLGGELLGLILIGSLMLALAWFASEAFVLRQVRAIVQATRRLRDGDSRARTGTPTGAGELGELARAFDQMAEALEQRVAAHRGAEEEARRQAARSEALVRTAARLNVQLDLGNVLDTVCQETAQALNVPAVTVRLYDEKRQALCLAASHGLPPGYRSGARPVPRSAVRDDLILHAEPVVIPDIRALPGLPDAELYAAFDIHTVANATLARDSELIGSLNVITFGAVRHFSQDELALLRGLAHQAGQAIANARLFAETRRRLENINALRTIDLAITSSHDLCMTLNVALEQVTARLGVDAAAVLLLNPKTMCLEYVAGRGFRTNGIERSRLRLGEGLAGRAALSRQVVALADLRHANGDFTRVPLLADEDFAAYYGVPLLVKGQVKGVLDVFHRAPMDPEPEWLAFLETLAGQAAIAIENATLFDGLQRTNTELIQAYDATIEGWSAALDLRDRETQGHSLRVTELTVRLASAMGVGPEKLEHVRRGALLHDIGKLGVPDDILLKPGALTGEEWERMRRHPAYAYQLLYPIAFLRPALDIPYAHHEKWDGTGYPRGLKREQIPLAARIFAVVDVWDALCSDRPYRPAWSEEKAREYIRSMSAIHFDPDVVEMFLDLIDREA